MSCGCSNTNKNDGRQVVDLVRSKGKDKLPLRICMFYILEKWQK